MALSIGGEISRPMDYPIMKDPEYTPSSASVAVFIIESLRADSYPVARYMLRVWGA